MAKQAHQERVISYFRKSERGYGMLLWGSKHFGYYPLGKVRISERVAQQRMQDLLAAKIKLRKTDSVLDAGCGQGVVATYLVKKYGAKITGITIVPFEVQKAQRLVEAHDVQRNVTFQVMDYRSMRFPDNHFDAVYTMESFVHSPEPQRTLREFFRVLKPGGRLAMFEYTIAPDAQFSRREKRMLDIGIEETTCPALRQMRHGKFPEMLRSAEFTQVKEADITANTLPSLGRLRRYALVPYCAVRLFNLQRRFVNVTIAVEWYKLVRRGLVRYCIFTARKP